MNIRRTIPPAAAPLSFRDLAHGLAGLFSAKRQSKQREAEVREYFGVKHVYLMSSGKAALTVILVALRTLSSRRRVVIPAYTCFSVPSSVARAGLRLALCDIDPHTLDFDFRCLEQSLDPHTLCVIPTHMLGVPSDVERVKALCRANELFVVEDAAQAMGGKYQGRWLGTLGDVAFFSLGRGKNITCGSGGIIVTDSDAIAHAIGVEYEKMRSEAPIRVVRNVLSLLAMRVLIHPRTYWVPAGLPWLKLGETKFDKDFPLCRMDGGRLGLLSNWQDRLERSNGARDAAARDILSKLGPDPEAIPWSLRAGTTYLRLPVLLKSRKVKDRLCALSRKHGLGISAFYPTSVQAIRELEGALEPREFAAAAMVADRLVTLPVHHLVRQEDRDRICDVLHRVRHPPHREGRPPAQSLEWDHA